jgi:acyl carrier protein
MISSRTPQGSSNHCAVCGHHVVIEPTLFTGDAPCPHCGHLLWFEHVELPSQEEKRKQAARFTRRDSLLQILAEQLNVSVDELKKDPSLLERLEGADSLDTVELVMEMEEKWK